MKITFEKRCPECGELFTYVETENSQRKRIFCNANCAKRHANRDRRLREGKGVTTRPAISTVCIPVCKPAVPYSLDVDPWQTGQLPASVTENALYSR